MAAAAAVVKLAAQFLPATMLTYLSYFTPAAGQAVALVAVLAVVAGLAAIGAAVGGRTRIVETDIVAGWAVASLAFVVMGGLLRLSFTPIAVALSAAAAIASTRLLTRRTSPVAGDLARMAALTAPAIWLAGCMVISQWDELTQWIPNARYIFVHDVFPGHGRPPSTSVFPAYPHGLAYVIYLASRITGHLVENASAVFSIVLLACLGISVGRVIRMAATPPAGEARLPMGIAATPENKIGWTCCAIGAIAVTALNPTFVPKIVFTGYADAPTMSLVGMLCVLMWMASNVLAGEDGSFTLRTLAISVGFTGMALVSVKQVNLVLFLLIVIGTAIVALRDPRIHFAAFLRVLPAMALPAIAMYALWRLHLTVNDVSGEFSITPYAEWLIDDIWTIFSRMLLIASKKGGYFITMLIACGFAVRALIRIRTPFDRLSLVVGTVFAGYTAFLLFAYVSAFGSGEALRAASYWRYNTHLGGACVVFGAYGLSLLWRRWLAARIPQRLGWAAIVIAVAIPFVSASKIRFDARPQKLYTRTVAEIIADRLPAGTRIAILDLTGDGSIGMIARYGLNRRLTVVGEITAAFQATPGLASKYLSDNEAEYVWIHVPTEIAERTFALKLPPRASSLLRLRDGRWELVESWPYPGYEDPFALPD